MVRTLERARRAARKAQEATYEGICSVIEYHDERDEETRLTRQREVTVIRDQPCRLSFEKVAAASQTETAAAVFQGVKLFLAPEVRIPAGSKIIVTQNQVTGEYRSSGEPAVYATHQEIPLELYERWA